MKRTILFLLLSIGTVIGLTAMTPHDENVSSPGLLQSASALRVVVLYDEDSAGAEAFAETLASYNFDASAQSLTQAEPGPPGGQTFQIFLPIITSSSTQRSMAIRAKQKVDFSEVDLLVIWKDTGENESWLASDPTIYADLIAANRPILGMGEGGYAFFSQFEEPFKLPAKSEELTQRIQTIDEGEILGCGQLRLKSSLMRVIRPQFLIAAVPF